MCIRDSSSSQFRRSLPLPVVQKSYVLVWATAFEAFGHDATGYEAEGMLLAFANLAGLPGLVVPAGFADDGLPVGLQIVGPRWSEARLLAVAGALERAGILPGWHAPPGY